MGQPISVVRKPTSRPDLVRFETNRVLTGMGHEHYDKGDEIAGSRSFSVPSSRTVWRPSTRTD